MGRTKEFDEAEVLDGAMALFRARGYAHTSFADLVETLGVSRQSLYDTYGDKHALYMTALKQYIDRAIDGIRRKLGDPAPVRQVFSELFEYSIARTCERGAGGCFMVNSMVELTPHDPDTRAMAQVHARDVERLFTTRLIAAQQSGEIARDKDPAAIARFLYHTLIGLGVAARGLGEGETLRESARLALRVLD